MQNKSTKSNTTSTIYSRFETYFSTEATFCCMYQCTSLVHNRQHTGMYNGLCLCWRAWSNVRQCPGSLELKWRANIITQTTNLKSENSDQKFNALTLLSERGEIYCPLFALLQRYIVLYLLPLYYNTFLLPPTTVDWNSLYVKIAPVRVLYYYILEELNKS